MIDVSKLLKDAPKGMKLYSPLFGEVEYCYIGGTDRRIWVCTKVSMRMFSKDGRYCFTHDGNTIESTECLLFLSKDNRTWERWKLPVEPKFKVHDWVISINEPSLTYRILETNVTNEQGELDYKAEVYSGGIYRATRFITSSKMDEWGRLWTIKDAKDGDVLVSGIDNPFIYNGNIEFSSAGAYVGISRDGKIRLDMFPSKAWAGIKNVKPATNEQRELLFQKIKEMGYEWSYEKKELHNIIKPEFKAGDEIKTGNTIETIAEVDHATRSYYCESGRTISFENQDLWHIVPKPHYDISNFRPFDKVLIRFGNNDPWRADFFSHIKEDRGRYFVGVGYANRQCIPFNDDTKHLLGTTDMPDEQYINW